MLKERYFLTDDHIDRARFCLAIPPLFASCPELSQKNKTFQKRKNIVTNFCSYLRRW